MPDAPVSLITSATISASSASLSCAGRYPARTPSSARSAAARSARPAASNASAASRRRLASRASTRSTSSSLRSRAALPATSSLATEVRTMRRVLVRTSSRAFIAAVRSARSRSLSPAMRTSCRLRRAAAPDAATPARQPPPAGTQRLGGVLTRETWHHVWMRPRTLIGSTTAVGAAVFGYATVVERHWFALRHLDVPVLPPGARPLRVLHISDAHLTPGRHRLLWWIRSLDALQPDLVVNTGDSIAHPEAVLPFLEALGPLLDRPGVFVYGSNDLYSPIPKNPARYLWETSAKRSRRGVPDLPWAEPGAGMGAAGWLGANNRRGRLKAGDLGIDVAGG